jgi:hypothetical protein
MKASLNGGAFDLLSLLVFSIMLVALCSRQACAQSCTGPGWLAGPDMPSTGVRMVGVYFSANGKFYAMGGRSMDGVGNDFAHPFEYSPGGSWAIKSATFPDNQVSNMACGVLTDSGTPYIYCAGGSAGGQTTATDRVFRYNPVIDSIESIAAPWPGDSDGITLPGGFAVFNNKLYILGGFRINTAMTNQIWEFDPTNNLWVQRISLPVARGYIPTVTYLGFIFTAGGSDWNGTTLVDTNDSFRYDPVTNSIASYPNIPRATAETRALKFADGFVAGCAPSIWVIGGGRTPPNPSNEVDVTCGGTWAIGPPFVTPRRNFPVDTDIGQVNFGTHHIWLAGGYASDGITPLSSMEIYCYPVPTPIDSPTPTPTATATATPTPTGSPAATVTPTATPSAPPSSPTPTQTVPPPPSPSPTIIDTPTPTPTFTRASPTPRPRPTPVPRP